MRCDIEPRVLLLVALSAVWGACAFGGDAAAASVRGGGGAMAASGRKSDAAEPLAPGSEVGMWVWHREELIDPAARAELIAFCRRYGISRIFVQVRFVETGDGGYRLATPESWRALLDAAARAGIGVEALDGANNMGFAAQRADTLARLRAALAFHRLQPKGKGFAGLHYDIEPYTSERWKKGETQAVMREFLETAVAIRDVVHAVDPTLPICHDIPAFYDGQEKHMVEFGGVRKNFHEHIQDLADHVGIMSYRTRATGPNSVASISGAELAYAAKIGKRVYLSLETVPLADTPQITFYGRTPEEYRAVISELSAHFKDHPAYAGLMLHQYRSMKALLDGTPEPATAANH